MSSGAQPFVSGDTSWSAKHDTNTSAAFGNRTIITKAQSQLSKVNDRQPKEGCNRGVACSLLKLQVTQPITTFLTSTSVKD